MIGSHPHTARRLRPWLLVALLACAGAPAQDGGRIVYVDMQRLIDSAPQIVQGRARLAQEFAEADARLKRDEQRLAQMEATLREQGAQAEDADPSELAVEVDALRRSIERSRQRLNDELGQRVQQETDNAWPQIEAAVAAYAREQGYDLVLQGPVLYASGRIDITDRVLDRLRADAEGAR